MSVRLKKPWRPCQGLDALPGHMGVFELADADGIVIYVGFAGGRSRYGLRGEIEAAVARLRDCSGYRFEVTTAYLTRYQELLMTHLADRGQLPRHNDAYPGLGRLSPG
jgi:hypothetical protein